MTKKRFVLGVVGQSNSGKTTLIIKLIKEAKKRGYPTAVVKHCPHGFEIDKKGKDSWRFNQAGAKGICLSGPNRLIMIRKLNKELPLYKIINVYMSDFDLILVEGYHRDRSIKKIEIVNDSKPITWPRQLVAVVSKKKIKTRRPVFKPDNVSAIMDFLEELWKKNMRLRQ